MAHKAAIGMLKFRHCLSVFVSDWSHNRALADFSHELTVGPSEMQGISLGGVGEMAHLDAMKYVLKPFPKAIIPTAINSQIKIAADIESHSS